MATKIDLYDNFVKFPTDEDVKKWNNRLAHLVYATPYMASIVEYAGRTCYKSFDAINDESYKKFITTVTKLGHESVIEHSNLVYVVFKKYNKNIRQDSDNINRHLITLMMYNGLLTVTESQGYYLISGNMRMFKDLIREYYRIKSISGKDNPILNDIRNSFYQLPPFFFNDMINNGILEEKKFKLNPKFEECTSAFNFKKLNDYVSVVNHDNFTFKVRGFAVNVDGVSTVRRLNTPTSVLKKHNRLTISITAPRYITHQLVRHRLASYSQSSQRYVLEEGNNTYMPETFKENHVDTLADNFFKNAMNTYSAIIDAGVKKEDARAVLPNAVLSTVIMTATIEEYLHFVKLRADGAAQNFIRDIIAKPLGEYISDYYRSSTDEEETPPPYKAAAAAITEKNNIAKAKPAKKDNGQKKDSTKFEKRKAFNERKGDRNQNKNANKSSKANNAKSGNSFKNKPASNNIVANRSSKPVKNNKSNNNSKPNFKANNKKNNKPNNGFKKSFK